MSLLCLLRAFREGHRSAAGGDARFVAAGTAVLGRRLGIALRLRYPTSGRRRLQPELAKLPLVMSHTVCPWWLGYVLASPLRRLFLDPVKLLSPYVQAGMTVLEPGPGMGFFTLELARLVGPAGRVVAVGRPIGRRRD